VAFSAPDADGFQVEEPAPAVVATAAPVEAETAPEATPAVAAATDAPAKAEPVEVVAKPTADPERNPDGTFKQKSKKGNPRHDPEARIAQALETARIEREARIRAEGERDALRPKAAPETPAQEWKRFRAMPDAPKVEDFDAYDDFTAALGLFIADKRYDERQAKAAEQQDASATGARDRERFAHFSGKLDAEFLSGLDARIADLPHRGVLKPGERGTVFHDIGDEIIDADNPKHVMQYLSDHPDEFQRIASLPSRTHVARAIAKLDTPLSAAPSTGPASAVPVSQAKPPTRPVESAAPVSDEPPGDDATADQHIDYWNRRDLAQRRGLRK